MIRKIVLPLFAFLLLTCSLVNRREVYVFNGFTMGTTFTVKIATAVTEDRVEWKKRIQGQIEGVLASVNKAMSTYLSDSELSRFNQTTSTEWIPVSDELAFIFQHAHRISRESGGAFDITVGPLVNLWGFGPESKNTPVPDPVEIARRKILVGYQKVAVRLTPPSLKKEMPGIYCDLSAVAKGYGVDKVGEFLESLKFTDYLIEVGGEIRTKGRNLSDKPWTIGISTPDQLGDIQKIIPLTNTSVATSGDYQNYFEENGVRYSHTIDPTTGSPVTHHLASVTVIKDTCMIADAYATAIDVLGPEKGFELASKHHLAVYLIIRENGTYIERMTPEFKALIDKKG